MKTIFLLLLLIFLITTITQAQWYEKSNGLSNNGNADAIDAYDSLIATGPYKETSGMFFDLSHCCSPINDGIDNIHLKNLITGT
jgi:hypothetical protein